MRVFTFTVAGAALVALTIGCSSKDHGTAPVVTPAGLAASGTVTFTAIAGSAVSPAPAVLVLGSDTKPFSGATVTFTVTAGGGQVTSATATSDAQGIARAGGWTLGTVAGANALVASLGSLTPLTFTATGIAGPPATVAVQSGDSQMGAAGAVLAGAISVKVTDAFGNPVPNVTVTFQITSGGGTLAGATASTDTQGIATLGSWTLGSALGTNHITATVGSLAAITFTATATTGIAVSLAPTGGDAQSGDLGVALPTALAVTATDALGHGVPLVPVSFALTSGSGTLSSMTSTTDANGVASTTLTLTGVGISTVTATSASIAGSSVVFSENTGPTFTGQVTVPPGLPHPFTALLRLTGGATRSGLGLSAFRLARTGGAHPTGSGRLTPAEASRRMQAHKQLIVSYRPAAFGMPSLAYAYRGASVAGPAANAYYAALAPLEKSGHLIRHEVSPAIAAVRVEIPTGISESQVMSEIRSDPRVLSVEEDQPVYASTVSRSTVVVGSKPASLAARSFVPRRSMSSPLQVASQIFATDPFYEAQLWNYNMIDLPRAWPFTTGSAAVRVAVVGVGIRADHPAVAPLLSTAGDHFDFTDATTNAFGGVQSICSGGTFVTVRGTAADVAAPRNAAQDPHDVFLATPNASCWSLDPNGGQGTHIAGIIGSLADDGVGGTGVNQNVTLISVRVLGITDTGFEFDAIQGILYAAGLPATYTGAPAGTVVQMAPAAVMNIGWTTSTPSAALSNAVAAAEANTLIVASSGDGMAGTPAYPGSLPGVLEVDALDPFYQLATYTNANATVSVAAPGGDSNPGSGILSSTWDFTSNVPNYTYYTGTAMAAAHVTGVAALLKALNPGMTPAEMLSRIQQTSIDLGPAGRDDQFGYGVVNARNALANSASPVATTTVRAIDAATGAVVRSVALGTDGRFALTRLPAGSYYIVAGQDESGDGIFGFPGRRLNWVGGAAMTPLSIGGTTVQDLSPALTAPLESEPNDDMAHAQQMVVDSWVAGSIDGGDTQDWYTVVVPTAGTYTFETSGVLGSCGYGPELDTELTLLDAAGNEVTMLNDDTPYPTATFPGSYCSLITQTLQPGRYFVVVTPFSGSSGTYRLHIRSGP